MGTERSGAAFDDAVFGAARALQERGVSAPEALFLLRTGLGVLPGRLERAGRVPLATSPAVPRPWHESLLHHGTLHGLEVWMLEDAPLCSEPGDPPWAEAFPTWLAAAAGATTLIHTSAGSALDIGPKSLPIGSLALLSDHVNLSGATPLVGLGETRLGPLFPDQTELHDPQLRAAALDVCERLGLSGIEAVGACTAGPSLETPAERRWLAGTGAEVAVQRLAPPLIAAAHGGLGALSIALVVNDGDGPVDIAQVSAVAGELAPALDDLLWELAGDARAHTASESNGDAEQGYS